MQRCIVLFLSLAVNLASMAPTGEYLPRPNPDVSAFATETLAPALLQRFWLSFQRDKSAETLAQIYHRVGIEVAREIDIYAPTLIGRGRFGSVLQGSDPESGRQVHIKISNQNRHSGLHFQNEIRAHQAFKTLMSATPNGHYPFPELYKTDGRLFLITDFFEGETLASYLSRDIRAGNHFSIYTRLTIMLAILDAVALCHSWLWIHFDLKPRNIILRHEGRFLIRLKDFGAAYPMNQRVSTPSFTVPYAAPEIESLFRFTVEALPTIDVYSLGVLLYELTARPREAEHHLSFREMFHKDRTLDIDIWDIIHKAIQMDYQDRFRTVHEMRLRVKNVHDRYARLDAQV